MNAGTYNERADQIAYLGDADDRDRHGRKAQDLLLGSSKQTEKRSEARSVNFGWNVPASRRHPDYSDWRRSTEVFA
jgi:hypothetical protein